MEPNYLVLLGIVIVIVGFALKLDAILIIIVAAVVTALVERTALCTSMKRSEPLPAMWIRVARAVPELIQQVARPSHAQLPLMLPESLGHSSHARLLTALVVRMKETTSPPHLHIAPYLPEAPFG